MLLSALPSFGGDLLVGAASSLGSAASADMWKPQPAFKCPWDPPRNWDLPGLSKCWILGLSVDMPAKVLQEPLGASPGELRLWRKLNGVLDPAEKAKDDHEHAKSRARQGISSGKTGLAAGQAARTPAKRRPSADLSGGMPKKSTPLASRPPNNALPVVGRSESGGSSSRSSSPSRGRASPRAEAAKANPARPEPIARKRSGPKPPLSNSGRPASPRVAQPGARAVSRATPVVAVEVSPPDSERSELDGEVEADAEATAAELAAAAAEAEAAAAEAEAAAAEAAAEAAAAEAEENELSAGGLNDVDASSSDALAEFEQLVSALSLQEKKLAAKLLADMIEMDELRQLYGHRG